MEKVRLVTGEPDCNIVGYCLGGTLIAMTLAWLAAKGRADEVKSATLLTTLVDFENAGDLKLFMDEPQLEALERDMEEKGYLDADSFRRTFSLLRANDTIWSFVVNNYLMGREPFPFDLLYWNDDATNMPAATHKFYLRKLYRENLLCKPGGISVNGAELDVSKIETPAYFISTKEDHIAPWQATYAATQLFKGPVTFTLAASGHVAGIVNPPAKNKYCFWTASKNPADPLKWLESATQKDGSWWTDWAAWVKQYAGPKIKPSAIGGGKLKPIEDAPGSYVRVLSDK
jgi:polyhydroxyalkanoate synthase